MRVRATPKPYDLAGSQPDNQPRSVGAAHGDAALLERLKGEFLEMHGFSPTLPQAARLFHMSISECSRLFDELSRQGFLQRVPDGTFRRMPSE
jgi:hypothetical protein